MEEFGHVLTVCTVGGRNVHSMDFNKVLLDVVTIANGVS